MRRRSKVLTAVLALLTSASALLAGGVTVPAVAQDASVAQGAPEAEATASSPLLGDFDGDGRADQFWYGPGAAPDHLWYGKGTRAFSGRPIQVGGSYTPLIGDFTGDGRDDIVWYKPGSGKDYLWAATARRGFVGTELTVNVTYQPFVADFDGDHRADIFWYSPTGPGRVWFGTGGGGFLSKTLSVGGPYVPVVGNFDGTGGDDVLWYGAGQGRDYVWRGLASRTFTGRAISRPGIFTPVVGDFRGDGRDDIYWHHDGSGPGHDVIWSGTAGGFAQANASEDGISPPFVGDFDGNHVQDLLWNEGGTNSDRVWFGGRAGFTGKRISVSGTYFPQIGDYDGDGRADVFWYVPGITSDPLWFGAGTRGFAGQATAIDLAMLPDLPLRRSTLTTQFNPYGYIAHAMGPTPPDAGGRQFGYTNTLEAFEHNYARGFRVFEVDWVRLGDGTVLAAHNGTEGHFGLAPGVRFSEVGRDDLAATYNVGGRARTDSHPGVRPNRFTPIFADDIPALLASHDGASIVLDTKDSHIEIFRKFVQLTAGTPGMMDRLMPHVARQDDLDAMRAIYPIRNYILALYRTQAYNEMDDAAVVTFVRRNRTPAVMMWFHDRDPSLSLSQNMGEQRRYTPAFANQLRAAGAVVYVHSIDHLADAQRFAARGIAIYSNGPFAGADESDVIMPPIESVQPPV